MLAQLHKDNPDDIRLIFRHFPLPGHALSISAAIAAEAAGQQGKFWEMDKVIFASQEQWGSFTPDQFNDWAVEQASTLGLNLDQFKTALKSQEIQAKVKAAQENGVKNEIPGTPFVLLNGLRYDGPRDAASLKSIMELFKLKDKQFTYCPPMQIDPARQYIATIQTEKGNVKLQLFPDKAPMAVNSFVFLARNGWFDDIIFHRVVENFVVQAGDPSGSGMGGPGYTFDDEITDLTFDKVGRVGMANAGPGSNGSQFFITLAPTADLNGKYTVFGEVLEGMDILQKLTTRDPQQPEGPGDKIITISIEEK